MEHQKRAEVSRHARTQTFTLNSISMLSGCMLGSTTREGAERWLGMHEGELGRDLSVVTSESLSFLKMSENCEDLLLTFENES